MNLKKSGEVNAFSHQHVFKLQKEQLVAIGFANGDKLLELKRKNQTGRSNGKTYVIKSAVGVQNVLFHIFAHQEADGLKELTHILLDLFVVDAEHELSSLAIERETDMRRKYLSHGQQLVGQ